MSPIYGKWYKLVFNSSVIFRISLGQNSTQNSQPLQKSGSITIVVDFLDISSMFLDLNNGLLLNSN